MKFKQLSLAGVYEITLERRGDERGFFARTFCETEFAQHGLQTQWAQMNLSFTATKGSLRGLHFQRPPHREAKLIRAVRGRVFDVAVDLRTDSPTFGLFVSVLLNAEDRNALYIPEGCAHGFQTVTDNVEMHYCHSTPYAPDAEGGVNPMDPTLGIDWPLPVHTISPRDTALPTLNEIEPL